LLQFSIISYYILLHSIIWFILLHFTLIYSDIKQVVYNEDKGNSSIFTDSFYAHNLIQIAKEEEIKKDFSNYLHDEVLQDLLSIKNMIKKSNKPEVQEIIIKTLDNLNISIRDQMHEYHPTILKALTLKENLHSLLETVEQTYCTKNITISFVCDDKLFLVEPYNLIVYRTLKELVTNAFKHSKCSQIKIFLSQEKEKIKLIVEDNGIGLQTSEQHMSNSHKGLYSIHEQVLYLNGEITITDKKPSGLCVIIRLPMKGEDSYQYFINR
jgi:two-component system secretion system sensor histidine kinase SalK